MNRYRVRVQNPKALGFLTQSEHYQDFELDSSETLEDLAGRLAAKGFLAPESTRWIMPGAIIWVQQKD